MKFCPTHWERLKVEVKSHGVADFVAADGHEAMAQAVSDLKGERKTRRNYDPLAAACWAIYGRAIEAGGLYLMTNDEHGHERCPLCELKKHAPAHPDIDENWIKGATKSAVDQIAELPEE